MADPNSSPDKAGHYDADNSLLGQSQAHRSGETLKMHSMVSIEVKEKQHAIVDNQKSIPDPESLAAEAARSLESQEVCGLRFCFRRLKYKQCL